MQCEGDVLGDREIVHKPLFGPVLGDPADLFGQGRVAFVRRADSGQDTGQFTLSVAIDARDP